MFLDKSSFGDDFIWGVSSSAYQTEGAHIADGKGLSIWDVFTHEYKRKIKDRSNGNIACDFYNRYREDIELIRHVGIPHFRFSLAWSRILPNGIGIANTKGIDYYHRVLDQCLEQGITPWVTLYHWDLPYALEKKGGWTNRDVVSWFSEYVHTCLHHYGDKVKHWMVLNEPMVFVGAGYFLGVHAPGRMGMKNFLPAIHHAVLCMAEGGRIIRSLQPTAKIGTTFSCSYIEPYRNTEKDIIAARKVDTLLNRIFIEPILGLGYPVEDLKPLRDISELIQPGDAAKMKFDFDFIGIQNYTREIVRHSWWTPYLKAKLVSAKDRQVPYTQMNWEVYPDALYEMIRQFSSYENMPELMITENGAAFHDMDHPELIEDKHRLEYLQNHIQQVQRAIQDGLPVKGYFVWTWTDNFEWAEGFFPKFGLVKTDFHTQKRIIKQSGKWYGEFIQGEENILLN
ncbi:MAG: GH1 family beta-glucosidase [Cytophagaceae bacterium]